MTSEYPPAVMVAMRALQRTHESNPSLFEKLVAILAAPPEHGSVELWFERGRFATIKRHLIDK